MAPRSTRNKIRTAVQRAIVDMDRCMEHLQTCDELSDGKSVFINEHLPGIIVMVEGMRTVLKQYYDML
jgi:hypothetical protein